MSNESEDYDEQAELTKYIWRGFRHLMTPDELLAANAFAVEAKFGHESGFFDAGLNPQLLKERRRYQSNAYVQEALSLGHAGFQAAVRDRMMRDMPESFFVHRCPACQRVVATPNAQQWLWCGEIWHRVE